MQVDVSFAAFCMEFKATLNDFGLKTWQTLQLIIPLVTLNA